MLQIKRAEVDEKEGKEFAKEIGAIFQFISTRTSSGIRSLFLEIGRKFLNSNKTESFSIFNQENNQKEQKLNKERRNKTFKNNCYIF